FAICTSGPKSFTSRAPLAGNCSLAYRVKTSLPARPDVTSFHTASTSLPTGVTTPSPVTPTRLPSPPYPSYSTDTTVPTAALSPRQCQPLAFLPVGPPPTRKTLSPPACSCRPPCQTSPVTDENNQIIVLHSTALDFFR